MIHNDVSFALQYSAHHICEMLSPATSHFDENEHANLIFHIFKKYFLSRLDEETAKRLQFVPVEFEFFHPDQSRFPVCMYIRLVCVEKHRNTLHTVHFVELEWEFTTSIHPSKIDSETLTDFHPDDLNSYKRIAAIKDWFHVSDFAD